MKKDFIQQSIQFIKKNWTNIIITSAIWGIIIVYIVINKIKLKKTKKYKKKRVIVLENMEDSIYSQNPNKVLRKGFCSSHLNSSALENSCNRLFKKSCDAVDCCVYAHDKNTNDSRCVAGKGKTGPIYKTNGEGVTYAYDYWYYLGKKYPIIDKN